MEKLQIIATAEFQKAARSLGVLFGAFALISAVAAPASAGLFTTTHFIPAGQMSVGAEVDLTLSSGAGVAGNLRYTQGVNELVNVSAIIGTGSGPRRFRVGGNMIIDFIPDMENQPGMGFAIQGIYFRLPDSGQLELTGIPYIHKTFKSGNNEIEPFLGIPLGVAFSEGRYHSIHQVVIGSMFKSTENFRYTLEFGIGTKDTETYFAGGVAYYP